MNLPEKISAKDVEVCVLTFNRCALLKQALESLAGQTAAGFLVSVYDNASSDATPEVVEAAKKSFGEKEYRNALTMFLILFTFRYYVLGLIFSFLHEHQFGWPPPY